MFRPADSLVPAELRLRIARLEGEGARLRVVLPFGIAALDRRLPGGGLALGRLHEIAGGDVAAACFAAGIAARIKGQVLWSSTRPDLYAPGLEQAGLAPGRVIHAAAGDDRAVLACMEEGLRHGALGTVVGEVARLPMTVSRRLHLAAKGTGTTCLVLHRPWRAGIAGTAETARPGAAMTRWRISVRPSAPLPVAGVGRPRWRVELLRVRAGEGCDMELEACDDSGRLGLPARLAGGPAAAAGGRYGTAD